MICYSRISINTNTQDLQHAVMTLPQQWMPHFNTLHYEGTWTALALRSPGGTGDIIPDLQAQQAYSDTPLMNECPEIAELIKTLKCPVMSVRLLNLKPGASIKPHKDHELAFEKGEARLHFPIFTNPKVEFYVEDQLIPMKEGECWYINANLMHRVSNLGSTDRIHLVVDCQVNDWLKDLFSKSESTCRPENTEAEQRSIIELLRFQNTNVANKLADQLENDLMKG